MTVLIMRVHFSGEHGGKVPRWLRKVVLVCLARVVRMHKSASETCKVSLYKMDFKHVAGGFELTTETRLEFTLADRGKASATEVGAPPPPPTGRRPPTGNPGSATDSVISISSDGIPVNMFCLHFCMFFTRSLVVNSGSPASRNTLQLIFP